MSQSKESPSFTMLVYNEAQRALDEKHANEFCLDDGTVVPRDSAQLKDYAVQKDYAKVRTGTEAIIICSAGNFIVGPRKGSHGAGTLAPPGGHLENHQDLASCAEAETAEETGLEAKCLFYFANTRDNFASSAKGLREYLTNWMALKKEDPNAVAVIMERDKCGGWIEINPRQTYAIYKYAAKAWFFCVEHLCEKDPFWHQNLVLSLGHELRDIVTGEDTLEENVKNILALAGVVKKLKALLAHQKEDYPEEEWKHFERTVSLIRGAMMQLGIKTFAVQESAEH